MNEESTSQRLKRIARAVLAELGIKNEMWDVFPVQDEHEYLMKVWREPVVQFPLNWRASDHAIASEIRAKLT